MLLFVAVAVALAIVWRLFVVTDCYDLMSDFFVLSTLAKVEQLTRDNRTIISRVSAVQIHAIF